MLVLGLILILLSAGSLVAVLSSGTDDKSALFGGTLEMPTLVVFLAGAAALLVFIMGLELVRSGIRRANENRKTKKKLRTLEKREEKRSDGSTPGAPAATDSTTTAATEPRAADSTVTEPGTTGAATRADTDPAPTQPVRTADPNEPTTGSNARGDEPYQMPPPPSR